MRPRGQAQTLTAAVDGAAQLIAGVGGGRVSANLLLSGGDSMLAATVHWAGAGSCLDIIVPIAHDIVFIFYRIDSSQGGSTLAID